MIKVFVVDDHSIVREGAKRIISDTGDMEVAGECSNGLEALRSILENDYDVVLLDIGLPGMDGLDVLREVKAKKPALPVLILSMYPEGQYASRVLREGASGYVAKESLPAELVSAIRKAARGKKYISDFFAENVACGLAGDDKPLHDRLSNKEYQVFQMIVSGRTTKEIAADLSLARSTVSTYRSRIMDKMKVKTAGELVRYAIENGLIP
jgi:two-component system, NarL family, invasion response regulator UvrY